LEDWQLEKPEEKAGWTVNGKDELLTKRMVSGSVGDPGCFRIRIFPSRIQGQKDSGSNIRIKGLKWFLTQKIVSKLSEL
jgi:hypothetical protein